MADLGRVNSAAPSLKSASSRSMDLDSYHSPSVIFGEDLMVPEALQADHCGSRLVMMEKHPVRVAWSVVIFAMLAYTASIFLYRFCFFFFHLGPDGQEEIGKAPGWLAFDIFVDVIFSIDLVINFFFSYKNDQGIEVDSMRSIAKNYFMGMFWVNLVACTPEAAGKALMKLIAGEEEDSQVSRLLRISRLQRMSRLTRLMRLTRLFKCMSVKSNSPLWKWFQSLRGVRVVNFIFGLMWTVHILACGWYLSAALHALHSDYKETWVARRPLDPDGATLLDGTPVEQWLHSMYFVLTVFTTVGFGDISAGTDMEIVYVAFTMVVGAVVHSIIISEVIQIVTSTDRVHEFIEKQLCLVEAFAEHAQLDNQAQVAMKEAIKYRARNWMLSNSFDKGEMRELITGKCLPRWLLGSLPEKIWQGALTRSSFLGRGTASVPPRLPCLLAVHLYPSDFEQGEVVFQMHDFPFNLFLVMKGTFANVAHPTARGGIDMGLEQHSSVGWRRTEPFHTKTLEEDGNEDMMVKSSTGGGMSSQEKVSKSLRMSLCATRKDRPSTPSDSQGHVFPYRLYGCNSYFGDVEMLRNCPRLASVRCESITAKALVLHRTDFAELKDHFPQFGALWLYAARRREWMRLKQRKRLTSGLAIRAFAAREIQRCWKQYKRNGRLASAFYRQTDNGGVATDIALFSRRRELIATTLQADKDPGAASSFEIHQLSTGLRKLEKDVSAMRGELQQVLEAVGAARGHRGGSPSHSSRPEVFGL